MEKEKNRTLFLRYLSYPMRFHRLEEFSGPVVS